MPRLLNPNQKEDKMSITEFVKYEQEIIRLKDEVGELKAQLRLANDLISFDINKASDGAAMNHANKLEKYRSNLVKCPIEFDKVFADNFKDILA